MPQTTNKPATSFRLRGVKVSVFANPTESEGRPSVFHKVTVQKIYKDGEQFKTTTSLGRDDLPVARLLLQRAWEYILTAEAEPAKENADDADRA